MDPIVDAGKPVFEVEYRPKDIESVCARAAARDLNTIRKDPDLSDLPWRPCR